MVAHQFDTIEQQREANLLGMWSFLVTEVMFFGGLFAAYCVYRYMYPQTFIAGSHHMNVWAGTINTAILLTSSFTMVLAVHFAKEGRMKPLMWSLIITLVFGFAFLGIKAVEYNEKFHHGLMIGKLFTYDGPDAGNMHLFMCIYFFMTGLHAIHVIIGMGIMAVLAVMAYRNCFTGGRYMPIEITGLYWHFVDLIWVFLFPLFYLIGTR